MDTMEIEKTAEHRRQCLESAERLFVRHGLEPEEIAATIPVSLQRLTPYLDEWQRKRSAYLAPLPSSLQRLQRMIDGEIRKYHLGLKQGPGLEQLAKLAGHLKGMMTVLDQVEGFIYLFNESFLPTVTLEDDQRALVDQLMAEFRGFLKLQLLSGNR